MVNRVDGNSHYEYQKLKNTNIQDTGEKFSLDYKQSELETKSGKDKDKEEKVDLQAKQTAVENGGVRLDLSGRGQKAASVRIGVSSSSKAQETIDIKSLIDTVKDFISTAVSAVKEFFYNLWYDKPQTDLEADLNIKTDMDTAVGNVSEGALSEREDITAESAGEANSENQPEDLIDLKTAYRIRNEKLDREVQPYLKKGDLNQVISLLTDNGKKSIAMNSGLLTYYDRNGRMVEPNASDRERILHGDINTRKL